MEQNKLELLVVEETSNKARAEDIQLLSDLQMALVGGGIGETTL